MIAHKKFKGILFLLCLLIYSSKPFIITKEATPDNSNDENETVYFDPKNDNLAFDTIEQYDDKTGETYLESIYLIQNLSDRVEQINFDQFPEKTVIQDKYDPKIHIKIIRVNFIVTNDDPCNEILEFSEKLFKLKFNNPDNLGLYKFRIIINNQNKKLFCYKIDENNIPQIPDNYDQIQNINYTIIDTSAENILNDTDVNKKDYEAQEDLMQSNLFFKDTRYSKAEEETQENEIPLQYDIIEEDRNFVVNETNALIQTNSIEENEIKTNPKEVILSNKNTFNITSNEYMNKHINMLKERQNSLATNKIPTPPLISQSPRLLSSERVKPHLNNNYYNDINTTFPFLNKKKDRQMQQNQQSSSPLDDLICQRKVKINKDEFYIGAHTYFNPNFINYVITTDGPDNINDKLNKPTESTNPKYQSKFTISNNNDEEKQLVSLKSSSIERNLQNSTENIIKNKPENSIFDKSNHINNLIEITKTTEGINEVTTNKYKFNIKEDYTTETSRKLHQTTKSPNERSTSTEENIPITLILQNNNSPAILLDYNDTNTKILQNENDHFRNYTDLEHNTPAVVLDYNYTNEKTTKNENGHFRNSTDLKHNLSTVVSDFNDTYTKTLQNENDRLKNSTDENHNSFGNSVINAGKDTIKGTIKGAVEGIYDKTKEYAGAAVEIGGKIIGIGKKGVNYLEYGVNYLGSKISSLVANPTKPTTKPGLTHHETHENNNKPKKSSKEIRLDVSKPKTENNNFVRTSANNEDKSKFTSGYKNNTKVAESDSKNRTKKSEKTLDSVNVTTTKKNLHQETQTKPPRRNLASHKKPRKTTENPLIQKNTNKTTNRHSFDTKTSTPKPFNWNANQNNLKNGSVLQNKIFEKAENFTKFNTQGIITKLEDKLETIDNFIQIGKFGLSFIGVLISLFFLMKYLKFFGCRK